MMTYFSLLLALTGIFGFFCYTRHIPKSVSAMVYGFSRRLQWLWSAWLVAVAALLLPVMMERLEDRLCVFGFLTFAFTAGAAVTPLVNRDTSDLHDWFGMSAGLMSQAVVTTLAADWLFAWLLFPVFLPFAYMRSRLVLVSELCCAISLYGCLLAPNIYNII
jgi:hypothetical protein